MFQSSNRDLAWTRTDRPLERGQPPLLEAVTKVCKQPYVQRFSFAVRFRGTRSAKWYIDHSFDTAPCFEPPVFHRWQLLYQLPNYRPWSSSGPDQEFMR